MLANPKNITAVSLWDPSFDLSHVQKEFSKNFVSSGEHYTVNWGTSYLISKAMYDEAGKLDETACSDLAKKFSAPVQVVHAGDGFYVNSDKSYHSFGNSQNIREVVAGTVHCFYEGNSCDDLLSKTKKWFDRF
jgi:predicted nucleic acid-binding Zn ribbon protein